MKTILFAAVAAVATLAPLQAAKVKTQSFVVKSVNIITADGKRPPGAPVFQKDDIVKLKITQKVLTGPQQIDMPIQSKSVTADTYYRNKGVPSIDQATVRKNSTTQKVIGAELNFTRPVKFFGVTTAGQITYILAPK